MSALLVPALRTWQLSQDGVDTITVQATCAAGALALARTQVDLAYQRGPTVGVGAFCRETGEHVTDWVAPHVCRVDSGTATTYYIAVDSHGAYKLVAHQAPQPSSGRKTHSFKTLARGSWAECCAAMDAAFPTQAAAQEAL